MLNALKPGVSPKAGGAKAPCECHQSHHNEGAPLPATSWLPQLLISGTLVLHPQATSLCLEGRLVSLLPDYTRGSLFLPALSNMDASTWPLFL